MNDVQLQFLALMKTPQLTAAATVTDENKPWVRYVMAVAEQDLTVLFACYVTSRKVTQIKSNPEMHLTCGVTDPLHWERYFQVQGRAELATDRETRHAFWDEMLDGIFSGPDDPNYAIVKVKPYRIEMMSWGIMKPEVWEA